MFQKIMITALCLTLLTVVSANANSSYSTTFDEFELGWFFDSSAAQGWYGNGTSGTAGADPKVDAEIVDLQENGGLNRVLRLSNATTSGNYGHTHAAPPAIELAGESATGAVNREFSFSFDFMSASPTVQEGLLLTCPVAWQTDTASRHALFYITDSIDDGFAIGFYDVTADDFRWSQLATNLDRESWHSVKVDIMFLDGPANDEVTVTLNGTTFTGLTTWEQYYAAAGDPQPEVAGIDTVIFRVAGNPVEGVRGGGVYFDNLSMSSVPEPATMALLGLGTVALMRKRRTA